MGGSKGTGDRGGSCQQDLRGLDCGKGQKKAETLESQE